MMMQFKVRPVTSLSLLIILSVMVFLSPQVHAVQICNNVDVFSDTVLTDDYQTTNFGSSCFILHNGADLDVNGHTISCLSSTCNSAVATLDAGSRVHSSSTSGARIEGPFLRAVFGPQIVQDLRIDSAKGCGICDHGSAGPLIEVAGNVITVVWVTQQSWRLLHSPRLRKYSTTSSR